MPNIPVGKTRYSKKVQRSGERQLRLLINANKIQLMKSVRCAERGFCVIKGTVSIVFGLELLAYHSDSTILLVLFCGAETSFGTVAVLIIFAHHSPYT